MKCKFCGKEFKPERITAEYCSAKCRVYSWRNKDFSVTEKKEDSVTEEDDMRKLREDAFSR